ncbi:GyrI-like domain-containing protein [Shouchella miscanthi]|uniref:GyrI-like domain-containing protein n=1 Tax=Shouchella miscanthi TaxID=2598861 RepID=A0ABU6NLX9_9BACI|nr:GyrI-like domain-containing protein [Shouchella miscanthi]
MGYKIYANVKDFESGLGKRKYYDLLQNKYRKKHKVNEHILLIQIYPKNLDFDPKMDSFTHYICFEVNNSPTANGDLHCDFFEESKYVKYIHKGRDSSIDQTYDFLYDYLIKSEQYELKDYDIEVWGENHAPEHNDIEIKMFIAIK